MLNKLLAFTLTLGCLGCAYGAPKLWSPAGANAAGVVFHINHDPLHPQTSSETSAKTVIYGYSDSGCTAYVRNYLAMGQHTFVIATNVTANGQSLYKQLIGLSHPPDGIQSIVIMPQYGNGNVVFQFVNEQSCVEVTCNEHTKSCDASGTDPMQVTLKPNEQPAEVGLPL